MQDVILTVNGKTQTRRVEARTLLVQFLRDHLGLTGTHVGCDTSQCGACTVVLGGKAVKSCSILASAAAARGEVVTIEGLSGAEDALTPMQDAFHKHHALQCGFCTPGMVMAAHSMVQRHEGKLTEDIVRHELEGNLCRCTGYHNIVKAVLAAAESYRAVDVVPAGQD
jgi:carbon-monoxide dehydrogenase small subunit